MLNKDEQQVLYNYLVTCRKPQTCLQCAEALGWSVQRTSAFIHQLYSESKIDCFHKHKKVKFTALKDKPVQKQKKTKTAIPPCEFPVHDYSGIVLVVGLVIILGLCVYFGI